MVIDLDQKKGVALKYIKLIKYMYDGAITRELENKWRHHNRVSNHYMFM